MELTQGDDYHGEEGSQEKGKEGNNSETTYGKMTTDDEKYSISGGGSRKVQLSGDGRNPSPDGSDRRSPRPGKKRDSRIPKQVTRRKGHTPLIASQRHPMHKRGQR